MKVCCDLEVDVNGQEIFFLDKKIIATYSGRLRKLFGKFLGTKKRLKVIFNDFPGSAKCFELIARFCYKNGRVSFTPSNVIVLNSAAHFMEMSDDINGIPNLLHQTETYLKRGIHYWTWSELVVALKQCQFLLVALNSSRILQDFLNGLVQSFTLPLVSSPRTSSSDNSSFQFSGDISNESAKNYNSQTPFWFEDLVFLNIDLFEKVVKTMISQKLDHGTICYFIFYYQKSKFVGASPADKSRILEAVISLLWLLDGSSIAHKGLFYNFRVAMGLKIGRYCKVQLEGLIGSRLDQATLDDLLVRAPRGEKYAYDVNMILRFSEVFTDDRCSQFSVYRLKKVGGLIDLYMAEVAPDPCLKPSKFLALALALPDIARDSHDKMYQAIDMYLEVHRGLCEEVKKRLFCAMNLDKLSTATLKQLAQNSNFPSWPTGTALFSQKSKARKPRPAFAPTQGLSESLLCNGLKAEAEKFILYTRNIDFSAGNEELSSNMRWRVVELDKDSKKLRTQMAKVLKLRSSNPSNIRSLPRLCRPNFGL